jgi:hypothetical protein
MKTNEEIFKILIEEGFSKGDVSVFDTCSSPEFIMKIMNLLNK